MAEQGENRLPIFELPMVILPGELLPLHIFEERYKRMIGWCLDSEQPFGIVFRDEDGSARRVGCTARVTEVLERFDDGRLNVVVSGEQPFRVLERWEENEYPAGEIAPITAEEAEELEADPDEVERAEQSAATREAFADLVRRVSGSDADPDEAEDGSAYAIAARVELPAETKQALLELRSETKRMRVLGDALRDLMDALRRSREIAERAKLNGKLVIG
ncbi:LON peptidase substrate-binding domain-containing protein [soil metagenome]